MSKLQLDQEGEQYFRKFVNEWNLDAEWEQRGFEKGIKDSIMKLLQEHGPVPESLHQSIIVAKDTALLDRWLKLAAKSDSIDEFVRRMAK